MILLHSIADVLADFVVPLGPPGGMEKVPDWLGKGLLAGAIAALGYVAKLFLDFGTEVRRSRASRNARVLELHSLLKAGKAIYEAQRIQCERLADMIKKRIAETAKSQVGYERLFSSAYRDMNEDEREIHSIIRSVTQHAVRNINLALSTWLNVDYVFKVGFRRSGKWPQLAGALNQLEAHLMLWHAKYEAWIPNQPQHSLVYLADEEAHGVGFPVGLDLLVAEQVKSIRPQSQVQDATETVSEKEGGSTVGRVTDSRRDRSSASPKRNVR